MHGPALQVDIVSYDDEGTALHAGFSFDYARSAFWLLHQVRIFLIIREICHDHGGQTPRLQVAG